MQNPSDLENDLATTYLNKANAIAELGDLSGAVALYDRCIAIWERLVESEGRSDFANYLATARMNKANAVKRAGDLDRLKKVEAGGWELYYETGNANQIIVNNDIRKEYLTIRGQKGQCELPRAVLAAMLLKAKQWGWKGGKSLFELQSGRVILKNIKGITLTKEDSENLALTLYNNIFKDKSTDDDTNNLYVPVINVCVEGEVTICQHN